MPEYAFHLVFVVALYVVLVASLDIIVGFLGITSASHAVLYGVGAYITAMAAARASVPPVVAGIAAIAGGAVVGAILSYVVKPLRGEGAVLGTLAIQLIVSSVVMNTELLGGARGIAGITPHAPSPATFAVTAIVLAVLAMLVRRAVSQGALGLRLRSIRDDAVAAAACGVNVGRDTTTAFAIAAAMAAAAGGTRALYVTYIDPSAFGLDESIALLTMLLVAGVERPWAPVIGVIIVTAAQEGARLIGGPEAYVANVRQIIFGIILVVAVLLQRPPAAAREVVQR